MGTQGCKNDEVKMLMPASTKQNEKIRKAVIVIDNSSASYPTNIAEITGVSVNPRIAIKYTGDTHDFPGSYDAYSVIL